MEAYAIDSGGVEPLGGAPNGKMSSVSQSETGRALTKQVMVFSNQSTCMV
jgi:hypothetical protein